MFMYVLGGLAQVSDYWLTIACFGLVGLVIYILPRWRR